MKTPERSPAPLFLAPLALTVFAAGCGGDEKEPPEEPIPPPEVIFCGPQITCAGPAISSEVGFTRVRVGVALRNEGCWDQSAGKSVWLGASPANRRVVTEDGERVEPNVDPELLLPENDTVVMPVSPGRTENRGTIRRVLNVPSAGADSVLVALQVNDIEVDAAARNHVARRANGTAPETLPRNCFECLTEDQRACDEMSGAGLDFCVAMEHPSIEPEVVQVTAPTAQPTDVQPCEDEPSKPEASLPKAVHSVLAQFKARENQRDKFRGFVAKQA